MKVLRKAVLPFLFIPSDCIGQPQGAPFSGLFRALKETRESWDQLMGNEFIYLF
jgi:hypothetical protein